MFDLKKILPKKPFHIGQHTENIAKHHLEKQGMIFIAQNYRCRRGEIDLIMLDKQILVFIEVRYRAITDYGSGAESITHHKRQKLIISAEYFLHAHPHLHRHICRFDVVALYQDPAHAATLRINWIKNAFDAF